MQDMKNIGAYVGTQKAKAGFAQATRNWSRSAKRSTAAAPRTAQLARLRRLPQPERRRHSFAQYPRVSGQHADYTASQLVAFRDGVPQEQPPDVADRQPS
jgi:cytochrome c553